MQTHNLAQHNERPFSVRGDGVAIIKHNSINHTPPKIEHFSSFECIGSVITSSHSALKFFVIHLLSSSSISTFFTEIKSFLELHISSNIELLFLGDFNIKIDNTNDYNTQHFN